jgi:toxin ParE1/3/4
MPTSENRRALWAPRAKQDLRDIWHYFARVGSPEIADKLLIDISQTAQRASDRPLAGRPRNELADGLRSTRVHPFTLFYRVRGTRLEVIRVVHERRDFAAIFKKTK